jgi:hypothetical protein
VERQDEAEAEQRRLRAVENVGVLDDVHQQRLDRLTRTAQVAFDVPASSITLVEADQAWYPTICGLPSDPVPRKDTYCSRALEMEPVVVSTDTAADPRFRDLPFATGDAALRFYAARVLRDAAGNALGTFCLFDFEPREFGARERRLLDELGGWAEAELLASAEMTRAHQVQAAMLPDAPLELEQWQVEGVCTPAQAVGGDYFDYSVTDGLLSFGLADVMGKGTGAALIGAGVRVGLRAARSAVAEGTADLGRVITLLEQGSIADLDRAGSFVTLFEGVVDLASGELRWVDAGLGLAVLVRADGTAEQMRGEDLPLGVVPGRGFTEHVTRMAPGDRLVVFSDGVLDLLDDENRWLEPVADLVRRHAVPRDLFEAVNALARTRTPMDDITVLSVYRRP